MYVLYIPTGFCPYYVQYVEPESSHVRTTVRLDHARRFATTKEAERHRRPHEQVRWVEDERGGLR